MRIENYIGFENGVHKFEVINWDGKKEVSNIGGGLTKEEAENIILNRPKPDKLAQVKSQKISEIKSQANEEIESNYPKYKQLNYVLGLQVNDYDNATNKNNMKVYIKSIIEQSETMETEINALTTEEEVKNYKVNFS